MTTLLHDWDNEELERAWQLLDALKSLTKEHINKSIVADERLHELAYELIEIFDDYDLDILGEQSDRHDNLLDKDESG